MAYENSTPGSSDCSKSRIVEASEVRMSAAVISRVCTGVSLSSFGVRVPVTTISLRLRARSSESMSIGGCDAG